MASQDYDEIEKIFAGKWIYDKDDENIEAFLKADGKKVKIRQQNSKFIVLSKMHSNEAILFFL